MAETFKNSFYNLAVSAANLNPATSNAQRVLIDNVTEDSPILAGMPFDRSSHNLYNTFARQMEVHGMDIIDFDAPLPDMDSSTQLDRVDLTALGGKVKFGEDLATQMGGRDECLNSKIPPIMRESGQRIERSIYHSKFLGTAVQYEKVYSCTNNPPDATNYGTMVAVTWVPGQMTGLFSPLPYSSPQLGRVFETRWINGGNVYEDMRKKPDNTYEKILTYGAYVKSLFGIQLANADYIAALVNITTPPTASQLIKLTESVRAGASTRIYCSRSLMTAIAVQFAQQNQGNGLISVLPGGAVEIMGVPFITSYNIIPQTGRITAPYLAP